MYKKLRFLTTLLLLAVCCGTWAEEVAYQTLTFPDGNNSKVSGYTATWTVTIGDFNWALHNFNNNNNGWSYVKCGRKNNASVGQIETLSLVDKAITKVVVTVDNATTSLVNSTYLEVSADNNFTNPQKITVDMISNGDLTYNVTTPTENQYYRLTYDCKSGTANGIVQISKVVLYYNNGEGSTPTETCANPSFSPVGGTYTSAQTVTISTETDGATIYYTTDGNAPTTNSSVYSSAINVSSTTTIKAMAVKEGMDNSAVAEATYVILGHAGTEADPYTVADARAAIDAGSGTLNVYATGIVSKIVTAYNSEYGNISYNISADGSTTADQLEVYRGKSYDGADFTSDADIQVGDVVVIYGNLKKHNETYEFDANSQLVSLDRPVSTDPVINADANVTLEHDAISGEIAYTITNTSENVSLKATTDADWISNITVGETSVTFTTTANEGNEDRTATFTLSYEGASDKTVTVTQKHFVADYATLPFEFNGGRSAIANTAGLTQEGLGTDYKESPYLKFDDTGDYLTLKINETPGKLTFDIKGNSFSGGTFKVQTSADGTTYTDLETYTELGTTQSEEFNLASNVRFIKWIYTNKSSGNVALGNINLAKPSTDPFIEVAQTDVNVDYSFQDGTIGLTYANLDIASMEDFGIEFYDANQIVIPSGEEPDWIEVLVAEQDPQVGEGYVVSYVVNENEGEARTAYFKVFALGGEDYVYSNLVTISQTAYVAPVEGATFTLAHSVTPGKEYIIVSEENLGEAYAMGAQKDNNRAAVKVDVVDNSIEVTSPDVRVFVIAADGDNFTIFDEVADGYLYAASSSSNHLKTESELDANDNGCWAITFGENNKASIIAQGTYSRNVMRYNYNNGNPLFACYASASQGDVYLYEKVEPAPETVAVSITTAGMATLSSNKALDFTNVTTIEAYYATLDNSGNVAYHRIRKVPAETGLLIRNAAGEAQGAVSADVPTLTETAESVEGNILVAALEAITGLQDESDGYKNYILNKHSQYGLGFYLANGKNLAANRAYMRIPVQTAREFIGINFDGDATGIESIRLNGTDNAIYDLQGRKVMNPAKGLYIVNGKKVVVK